MPSRTQFSIRALLIVTTIVAADLAWVRWRFTSRYEFDSEVALEVPRYGAMLGAILAQAVIASLVIAGYRICRRLRKTTESQVGISVFATALAGLSYAGVYLAPMDGWAESVVDKFISCIGLGLIGAIVAGLPSIPFSVFLALLVLSLPKRAQGRAQVVSTGVVTAFTTSGLLFASTLSPGEAALEMAIPMGFALVICYPFGKLWDDAKPPAPRLGRMPRMLDRKWTEESHAEDSES